MQKYELLMWALKATWVLFVFAYGACLGSLTNVIAYRMPLGLSIVRPPSRCPKCDTRLSWRDNIPVLGWIALRGRCRYCKARISPEYPIVEAAMGLLFVLFYVVWYVIPPDTNFLGFDWSAMTPRWAAWNDPTRTWPEFVTLLLLLASLFAMTLVDAKTFTIPIWLTWFPALVAVIAYPIHAAWVSRPGVHLPRAQIDWTFAIATPGFARWDLVGLSIGAVLGLAIGLFLIKARLIGRSFADYPEWEAKAKAAEAASAPPAAAPAPADPPEPSIQIVGGSSPVEQRPAVGGAVASSPSVDSSDPGMWMAYPHARREMVRELAFLAPAVLLAIAGSYAGRYFGGMGVDPMTGVPIAAFPVPYWLMALSGVLWGYLIGGGVVWFVRIAGSFAFGKEAMGMGDVHLMAGVGACLGWIDATLGFFGAAFVGLGWAILGRLAGGGFKRMLPYGPFLAVSTVLVMLCKPLIERGLTALTGNPIHLP